MKVPDTKLLETFLIIAQERNLISAASTLEVSQPTLTQRLQKLEKFLGSS
ncbi:MAG: LysR family transcriptional regulator, partial [Rhodobacteraceae bacterium]|nr:LysR family transcriptional regulator [Paracoccaceae bacterium]